MKLYTKTGDVKDLNANFVSHLEKRDVADGTSHADTWRSGLIHGPRAPFTVPYNGEARASDSEVREEVRADTWRWRRQRSGLGGHRAMSDVTKSVRVACHLGVQHALYEFGSLR